MNNPNHIKLETDQYGVIINWPNFPYESMPVQGAIVTLKNNIVESTKGLSSDEAEWLYDVLENGYIKGLNNHIKEVIKHNKETAIMKYPIK